MNRGHLLHQSSPVQQMMTNPNWWNININTMRSPQQPPPSNPFLSSPSYFLPNHQLPSSWQHDLNNQQHLPPADSWTQLLMSGSVAEQDRGGMGNQFQAPNNAALVDIKQESSSVNSYGGYGHGSCSEEFQAVKPAAGWPHQMVVPASSPKSCVTSFSSNMLDFSNNPTDANPSLPDPSSEGNSSASGGAKKARVQASGAQSPFKVKKEKLGDRITALHQLVSPFGKTDTASVLLEAIGYIRFLQSQIEALSLPYLGNITSSSNLRQQHSSVRGENNCIFPQDPGQLLHENSLKRKAPASNPQNSREEGEKDLRSRGLCLVPVSCTMQVGSDNGADYWAPALGAGFQ